MDIVGYYVLDKKGNRIAKVEIEEKGDVYLWKLYNKHEERIISGTSTSREDANFCLRKLVDRMGKFYGN